MTHVKTLITIIILSIVFISCKENIPVEQSLNVIGRNDYTWHYDTLNVDQFHDIHHIWGKSINDLWIFGYNELWHHKDFKWQKDQSISPQIEFEAMYGFESGALVLLEGNIANWGLAMFQNKGNSWSQIGLLEGSNSASYWMTGMYNNFAVGYNFRQNYGVILQIDGSTFTQIKLPECKSMYFMGIVPDRNNEGTYYLHGEEIYYDSTKTPVLQSVTAYKIFEFNGKTLKQIYSSKIDMLYPVALKFQNVFTNSNEIKFYNNGSFIDALSMKSKASNFGNIKGRSINDLFLYQFIYEKKKMILHFNGTETKPIFEAEDILCYDVFDDGVCIVSRSNNKCIIATGTLK